MSVPCCSSSVSQPSRASIHISGDEEQDVPIGGVLGQPMNFTLFHSKWTLHSWIFELLIYDELGSWMIRLIMSCEINLQKEKEDENVNFEY